MHFGENQLSRSLIGLSPLPTAHPPSFQPRWVRSSTRSYTCFNLAMGRSPRFGSRTRHYTIALFGLALATATPHGLTSRHATDSQAHSSKGTPPPPHTTSMGGSDGLQAPGFRYYFTPLPGYFSPFPHGTMHYRSSGGIQAAKWSWQIHTGFHEPRATRAHHPRHAPTSSAYGGITHYATPSQTIQLPASNAPGLRQKTNRTAPQPRTRNPCRVSHAHGLTIIRFRSPLLTEYLLLRVLRCFTSPRHPPHPIQFRCR